MTFLFLLHCMISNGHFWDGDKSYFSIQTVYPVPSSCENADMTDLMSIAEVQRSLMNIFIFSGKVSR